jgi:type I restriction-modification system DNA methylase subunit
MIFTGVILIASKYSNACFEEYAGIQGFKQCVVNKITSRFTKQELKSKKINDLVKAFSNINIGTNPSDSTIAELCSICASINKTIEANPLSNIDIMNIFFTEFNKYRGKSEHGQIFTPDHIASLMSKLIDVNQKDIILDPTCGSGSLLIKASNLNHKQWGNIYGNDFDMNVLFLSYINMLLHNDGITNLENYDALSPNFCE